MDKPFSTKGVRADAKVLNAGDVYHGGILLATAGGQSTVAIYDGVDANGELIDYFDVQASQHAVHIFEEGLALKRGLFVDVGNNVSAFTLYFEEAG
jgi:hypothetical protein